MGTILLNVAISDEFFYGIIVSFCLLLTLVIEVPLALIVSRKRSFLLYSMICNLATNPLLNIVGLMLMQYFGSVAYTCWVAAGEIAVLFAEASLYYRLDSRKTPWRNCFFVSLACNAVSFVSGLIISALISL